MPRSVHSSSDSDSILHNASRPASLRELFWSFTKMALQGFGGVLPVAERVLVHERRWMTEKDFVESLAIAQALPGPNVCNLSLAIGDRFFGARGAAVALAGMMSVPAVIVISLTLIYQSVQALPLAQSILLGMGASAIGLIIGMGIRLARTQGHYRLGWLIGMGTFILIAFYHLRLGWVVLLLGLPSFVIRLWQLRQGSRNA